MFTLELNQSESLALPLIGGAIDVEGTKSASNLLKNPRQEKDTFPLYIFIAKLYTNRRCSVSHQKRSQYFNFFLQFKGLKVRSQPFLFSQQKIMARNRHIPSPPLAQDNFP